MAFDNIKLEKGLYSTGKSFTSALEEMDPSENYIGTALEGLDAYERQLKRFDIKVSGSKSDPISKFFATTDSSALFPEYIARAVKQGIEDNNTVDQIVASTTEIDSLDYRSIAIANKTGDLDLDDISEGEAFTEMKISTSDTLTKLKKHGKMISASYEAIKFQKLDLFTTVLKNIGANIAHQEFIQALQEMLSGDDFKAIVVEDTLSYKDLVALWSSLAPFTLTTIVAGNEQIIDMLDMEQFQDSAAGLTFHGSGIPVTPFGAQMFGTPVANGTVIGLDKNCAIEKVQAGGVLIEYDKLIDRQLERATISTITGFSSIYKDAIAAIDIQ